MYPPWGEIVGLGEVLWDLLPAGKQLGFVRTPETATNCVFGDPDGQTLFITAGSSVYKVRVNATGYRVK